MSYQDRRIAIMIDRHNDRLLNEHPDSQEAQEQREDAIEPELRDEAEKDLSD